MEGELEQILTLTNADGAGEHLGVNGITAMGASQSFQDQVREVQRRISRRRVDCSLV